MIGNNYIRIADKKRKIVEFIDKDNIIQKCHIEDKQFLDIISIFTTHILSIVEIVWFNNNFSTPHEEIQLKFHELSLITKEPIRLIPHIKTIIDYNKSQTQKTIKKSAGMF
jgi:hypothetical protein